MIEFRRLKHEDYEDIVDISKNIWNGSDYLPKVYHRWVDDEGYFLGVVDAEKNKVIGVGKFSILYDGSGWLEGLRVHKDYRGQKIAREISEKLLGIAKGFLKEGKVRRIAFGTHISNTESITLMKKLNFNVEAGFLIIEKPLERLDKTLKVEDFKFEAWNPSLEEFTNLPYFRRRNNILPLDFVFQEPTKELYEEFKNNGGLISINGYKGIYKFKADHNFACIDESFEAIDTFMNYYLMKYDDLSKAFPVTSIIPGDKNLVQRFREEGYAAWAEWKPDYLYMVYKER